MILFLQILCAHFSGGLTLKNHLSTVSGWGVDLIHTYKKNIYIYIYTIYNGIYMGYYPCLFPLKAFPKKNNLFHTLRIQVCPKKGINPTILLLGWDWDHQTYSREGYGSLGIVSTTSNLFHFHLAAPAKAYLLCQLGSNLEACGTWNC